MCEVILILALLPLALFLTTFLAGFLGAMFGIGGGAIIVPILSTIIGIPIKEAVAASLVCIVATSIASSRSYIAQKLVNLRLALFLETNAAIGAVLGAFLATIAPQGVLHIVLGLTLIVIAVVQLKNVRAEDGMVGLSTSQNNEDSLAKALKLSSNYYDFNLHRTIEYQVTNSYWGLATVLLAGTLSSVVGIGGGAIKVPIMNRIMNVPIKVSMATSAFMIGLTSSIGVMAYLSFGLLNFEILPLMVVGTMIGSTLGSRIMGRVRSSRLLFAFAILLIYLAYTALSKGVQIILSG
ncbi:MAG: sulfite exporter TauE/SafE family protein [Candidatus Nezhaarchaeales archaeon]